MTSSDASARPRMFGTGGYLRRRCHSIAESCRAAVSSWIIAIHTHVGTDLVIPHVCETLPITLFIFAIIIVQLQQSQLELASLPNHVPDFSVVPGRYGPGSYYAWLINALIVAFHPESARPEAQSYTLVATLGTATYAMAAAIDQLLRSLSVASFSQPIFSASDRVNQFGWVIASMYLLRRYLTESSTISQPLMLRWSTAIWMLAWFSHTAALITYNIHRGDLSDRVLRCGIPLIVGIPLPLATIYVLKRYSWVQWDHSNWQIATVNTGALAIGVAYLLTPRQLRYDADSPTTPLAAANMTNGDQIATLVAGLMFVVPHFLLAWEGGWGWVVGKLGALRVADILDTVASRVKTVSSVCRRGTGWLLGRFSEVSDWLKECVIGFAGAIGVYLKEGSTSTELDSRTFHSHWCDAV